MHAQNLDGTGGALTGGAMFDPNFGTPPNYNTDPLQPSRYPTNWAFLSDYERTMLAQGKGYFWENGFWSLTQPDPFYTGDYGNTDEDELPVTFTDPNYQFQSYSGTRLSYQQGEFTIIALRTTSHLTRGQIYNVQYVVYQSNEPYGLHVYKVGKDTFGVYYRNRGNVWEVYKSPDSENPNNPDNPSNIVETNGYFFRYYTDTQQNISGGDLTQELRIRYQLNFYNDNGTDKASLIPILPNRQYVFGHDIKNSGWQTYVYSGDQIQRFTPVHEYSLTVGDSLVDYTYTIGRGALADQYGYQTSPWFKWNPIVKRGTFIQFAFDGSNDPLNMQKQVVTSPFFYETTKNENGEFVFDVDFTFVLKQQFELTEFDTKQIDYLDYTYNVQEDFTFSLTN